MFESGARGGAKGKPMRRVSGWRMNGKQKLSCTELSVISVSSYFAPVFIDTAPPSACTAP